MVPPDGPTRGPSTIVGRLLCAYLLDDEDEVERLSDGEDSRAGLLGPVFILLARRRFGRPPDVRAITGYVRAHREHDPELDPLVAEATIRVALDQLYVRNGLPEGTLLEGMLALWQPLAHELLSSPEEIRAFMADAEELYDEAQRFGAANG